MGLHPVSTAAWIASGLAGLSGRSGGPALVPPPAAIEAIGSLVAAAPVAEPLALLGERAALAALTRAGAISCGGSARLLAAADGWVALNLARPDDLEVLPAWLRLGEDPDDPWSAVGEAVRDRDVDELLERAVGIGLPMSRVGEVPSTGDGVVRRLVGDRDPLVGSPLVVDLSSLWAGPLCSHLLGLAGARVVKVESTRRPDGGRQDDTAFFDLLNHDKASVALDLPSTHGLARLRSLLGAADVVIEGSRPRALRNWGIDAEAFLAHAAGPRVWVSVTAYGRAGPGADRVGFGDDAAAAGGLVLEDDTGPCFLADAVADPLTGIAAAVATTEALAAGGNWLVDAALARVAASVARPGPARPVADAVPAPRSRPVPGPARPLGADTDVVLAGLR